MKFINKVLLRWRNYENSRVLHSIRSKDGSSSRTRTLLWNYQEDYKNCRMKPTHSILDGMLRPSFVSPRRKEGSPCIWDTHGFSGNVFANPNASSSAPYPQELNPWGTTIEEPLHMSTAEKSERPEQNRDLRCQSGPSAKNSLIFSGGVCSKNYGADQQRLQMSDLHLDKFPTLATFACWKISFKTEV